MFMGVSFLLTFVSFGYIGVAKKVWIMTLIELKEILDRKDFTELKALLWNHTIPIEDAKKCFLFIYDYTNSFKNSNTSPEIFEVAWMLLEYWIEHDKLIVERLKKSYTQMKFCSEIIKTLKLYRWWTIIWWIVPLEALTASPNENCIWESFLNNILITISWTIFWFLLVEREKDEYELFIWSKFMDNPIEQIKEELWLKSGKTIKGRSLDEILSIITK